MSIICIFIFITATVTYAGGGGKLDFRKATLISGIAGADGAIYRFSDVDNNIDALVRITKRSDSLVYLANIDMSTSGFDKAFQPAVGYNKGTAPKAADWWMEFEMSFVKKGTTTPIVIDEFDMSAIDIDGNGDKIREYISLYGLTSYTLEASSVLTIQSLTQTINGVLTTGKRFDGPTVNFLNIDTSGTGVMVTANYQKTQKFTFRTGAVASAANGASERMYSLYFQSFKYNQPTQQVLPIHLISFTAKLVANKVMLDWKSADQETLNYYVVECSTNGKEFTASQVIYKHGKNTYDYAENISSTSAVLYFRLKAVQADGTFDYSSVRSVKVNGLEGKVSAAAYPNPFMNTLTINVPVQWQNKPVQYEVISLSGRIITQLNTSKANQQETFQVNQLPAGSYMLRISSANASLTQLVVKK